MLKAVDAPGLNGDNERVKSLPPFISDVTGPKLRVLKSPSLLVRGNGTESVSAACISCEVGGMGVFIAVNL